MFSHVSVLLSFVYAIAITHLLTSATELVWARDRVRPSWIQVAWMVNALLALFLNWIGMWFLNARASWDVPELVIVFTAALIQYFTCSLISIRVRDEGPVDMPAFFKELAEQYALVPQHISKYRLAVAALGLASLDDAPTITRAPERQGA